MQGSGNPPRNMQGTHTHLKPAITRRYSKSICIPQGLIATGTQISSTNWIVVDPWPQVHTQETVRVGTPLIVK